MCHLKFKCGISGSGLFVPCNIFPMTFVPSIYFTGNFLHWEKLSKREKSHFQGLIFFLLKQIWAQVALLNQLAIILFAPLLFWAPISPLRPIFLFCLLFWVLLPYNVPFQLYEPFRATMSILSPISLLRYLSPFLSQFFFLIFCFLYSFCLTISPFEPQWVLFLSPIRLFAIFAPIFGFVR